MDDDPRETADGGSVALRSLGTIDQLADLCESRQVREVLIAIPSATGEQMRRIIGLCRSAHVEFRTLPSVGELMEGGVTLSQGASGPGGRSSCVGRPIRVDRDEIERLHPGQARPGDGGGRIHRFRAVSAARDLRAGRRSSCSIGRRMACSSSTWSCGTGYPALPLMLGRGRRRG